MSNEEERLKILDMLREGQIGADEAERRLAELGDEPLTEADDGQVIIMPGEKKKVSAEDAELPDREQMWVYPFVVGVGILGVFGWMASAAGFFLSLCLWPFALVGGAVAGIGLWSRRSHWIHVRVRSASGENINLSLPVPLGMVSQIMRWVEPYIESKAGDVNLGGIDFASLINMMGDEISPDNPIMVAVDEEDSQVLVYIT
jgi:hypothetical protein